MSPAAPEARDEEMDWRAAVTAPERLAALAATGLFSAESDADLDRLTALARRALGVPVVMLTLVGERELLCKSLAPSLPDWRPGTTIPVEQSCCRLVVARGAPLPVPDIGADAMLAARPGPADHGVSAYLGVPLRDAHGQVLGALCALAGEPRAWTEEEQAVLADFAALAEARIRVHHRLREQARARQAFELLDRMNRALLAELDIDRVVRLATDLGRDLVGAEYCAFFDNVRDEEGGADRLFALSGGAPDGFDLAGMPRRMEVFDPTFDGLGPVRSDDITREPHFGRNPPYDGFPPDHPRVRSYLAVPVVAADGETIGGLFFGHSEPGRFDALDERLAERLAAKTAIAFTNARLYAALRRELAEREKAEAELRAREEHIRLLLDSTAEGIYGLDTEGRCTFCNRSAARLLGYDSPEELVGRDMHAMVHHSRTDGAPYPLADCPVHLALRAGEPVHRTDEVFWRPDGTAFHAEYWSHPMVVDGRPVGCVVTFLDIDERVAAAERQRLLVRELNHRVRNTLAVVQSLARQSLRTGRDPAAFAEAFELRLQALARAHRILTDRHWQGAELRELVDTQLAALAEAHDDRIDASGPPVVLAAAVAVPLALILHELGTNAVKHGALATPDGRVEVRWERTTEGGNARLRLVWRERGAGSVTRPERRGLGTLLVENGLGPGRGRMVFEREGVVCELDVPLPPAGSGGGRADVAA